jgi:hypothetical protein
MKTTYVSRATWIRFISYLKHNAEERAAKKKMETPTDKAARRTAAATMWMAFFTCILAFTSGLTIWILKNQLKEMQLGGIDTHALATAADTSANAATDQADAAQQFSDTAEEINQGVAGAVDQLQSAANSTKTSINATKEAMQLDQRAWLGVDAVNGLPKIGEALAVDIGIKNTGKTPAKEIDGYVVYRPVKRSDSLSFEPGPATEEKSHAMIPPNSIYHLIASPPPPSAKTTQADLDAVKEQRVTIYIFGKATYRDIFSCGHWLTFCMRLRPDAAGWLACKQYNDTNDDPCPAKKPN